MAVDAPVLYNNWWVYLRYDIGSTYLNPNDMQVHNAYLIRAALKQQGYTDVSIAGILGNWQVESGLTPGALDTHLSVLPDSGEHLALLTNQVMLGYCNYSNPSERGYGTGLAQWDRGVSSAAPQGNVVASFAIRNNMEWYDGNLQMMRLEAEYQADLANPGYIWKYNWGQLSWQDYKNIPDGDTPIDQAWECANIWASCFEVSDADPEHRRRRMANAGMWYLWFKEHPIPKTTMFLLMASNKPKLYKPQKKG